MKHYNLPLAVRLFLSAIFFSWAMLSIVAINFTIDHKEEFFPDKWQLLACDVTATVYNAVPEQTNEDCLHTASMYCISQDDIQSERIVAIERTMLDEYGLSFGDSILVEGAGQYDGIWYVRDLMNKRFKGQHRIDFLVPENIKTGKWQNVKLYAQK